MFLAYFATGGAANDAAVASNGLLELHGCEARGFRNRQNYRLSTLVIAGGLQHPDLA